MTEYYWKNIMLAVSYYLMLLVSSTALAVFVDAPWYVAAIVGFLMGCGFGVWIETTPRKFMGRADE